MIVRDIEHARDMLADALWWLKGFAAAATSDHDDIVYGLSEGLREVRVWLESLQSGHVRRLGDERAIVLTYPEVETLLDGLREHAPPRHRQIALGTLRAVFDSYQAEARAARDAIDQAFSEAPF